LEAEKKVNNITNPNFIGQWSIKQSLCDEIIKFFNSNNQFHAPGISGEEVNLAKKKSIDLEIKPKNFDNVNYEIIRKYFLELENCYEKFKIEWPFLAENFKKVDIGSSNIQKYEPGGHFSKIHCERTSLSNLHRLFAFMTYLNEDFEGGHTFFSHYNLSIKPEKGKTLIWPAEWTHAHKGEIVESGSKYIITGWLNISHTNF